MVKVGDRDNPDPLLFLGWEMGLEPKMCIRDSHEVAHGSLRLSLSHYNTDADVDHILSVVPGVVEYLRNMSPVWDELERGERPHLI